MEVVSSEVVDAGQAWSGIVEAGQHLRITDLEGRQGVDFLCYNADNPLERYHAPNTLKAAGTLRLTRGHTLYSDEARPIFTMVADTVGGYHDTIGGCCSAPSNESASGVRSPPVAKPPLRCLREGLRTARHASRDPWTPRSS